MIRARDSTYTRESKNGLAAYEIPVEMRDKGSPPQLSTQTLVLNLPSENDNPHSAGTKRVQVYNYKVQSLTFVVSTALVAFRQRCAEQ